MFKKANTRQNFPEMERELMAYWKENEIFEKSINGGKRKSIYSFFDGPPFATGLPHYGHVVGSLMKDVVPRFWTMKGKRVERRWGWDCHGLPIENMIEKEHNIKNKKDIEKWGVDKFNDACHSSVLRYADEWKKFIPRVGRWVDMDNDYKTMDWKYTESIWWVFSELFKKGLIYEGYKSMHLCPRCETTLANFEVALGYKTVKDFSVIVKFKITDKDFLDKYCGGKPTSFLAWTTTPWSVPTTMALAIGGDFNYTLFSDQLEQFICVKERLAYVIEKGKIEKHEIIKEIKGKNLEHVSYLHPFFDFYKDDEKVRKNKNAYKTHLTDYVSLEDGTGIVTINGAFGEIDMQAAKKIGLPIIVNVRTDGTFTSEMKEFAGMKVKSAEDSQKTDIEIIKFLAHSGTLFAKEKYEHSYPHCWRCDTPLINYATSSWFVKVTDIKDKMIKNNKEIRWVPGYIKDGRFGKWLEDARDWAVSRSRFWGAPLPVWKCKECNEKIVLSSIDELRNNTEKKITKVIFMRHGESGKNLENIKSDSLEKYPLTEDGIGHAKNAAKELKDKKIDIIIASPVLRTRQTAEIISKALKTEVVTDDLVMEYKYGSWNDKTAKYLLENDELYKNYKKIATLEEKYDFVMGGDGESRRQMEVRVRKFIDQCIEKYPGKNVLVVSHSGINAIFRRVLGGISIADYFEAQDALGYCGSEIYYVDESGKQFNMHKPNIDMVQVRCPKCGKQTEIVGDVFDCWFESGSMPYGQWHYPFENKDKFNESFPADFIAEGLDQTRGWFYTLIVLSTALFDKPAFKNVMVNGIVLAEDGQKMSKSLKNYPDPSLLIEKYGADSLRYYLLSSPVMKGENLNFSEKGVDEVLKRFILILWNAYSFLVMNLELAKLGIKDLETGKESDNFLDKWIVSELNMLKREVNEEMENYDLVKASRPLRDFVDKLSNWYIRRSRKRFSPENDKNDRMDAFRTLYSVMVEYSKTIAPFMPFLGEEMFRNLTGKESVHLEKFPGAEEKLIDNELSKSMDFVRRVTTLALAARSKSSIKVRMPLGKLEIGKSEIIKDTDNVYDVKDKFTDAVLDDELFDIIKDELNVKEAGYVDKFLAREGWAYEDDGMIKIGLNIKITEELEIEGYSREIIRHVQMMRKEAKYERDEKIKISYSYEGDNEFIEKMVKEWNKDIKKECLAAGLDRIEIFAKSDFDLVKELKVKEISVAVCVKKA